MGISRHGTDCVSEAIMGGTVSVIRLFTRRNNHAFPVRRSPERVNGFGFGPAGRRLAVLRVDNDDDVVSISRNRVTHAHTWLGLPGSASEKIDHLFYRRSYIADEMITGSHFQHVNHCRCRKGYHYPFRKSLLCCSGGRCLKQYSVASFEFVNSVKA